MRIVTGRSAIRTAIITLLAFAMICLSAAYASAASVKTASAEGYINAEDGAIIRKEASTSSSKVGGAKDNARVFIKKEVFTSKSNPKATNKWYYVYYGSTKGYVRSDLVDGIIYNTTPAKTTCALNVRTGPTTSMAKKAVLKKNKKVEIALPAYYKGSSDVWYRIKYGTEYMYISGRVKALSKPTSIRIDSLAYPTELMEGQSYSIRGVITSNKDIEKVTVKVLNSKGKTVIEKSASPNVTIYSLFSLDKYIGFGTLNDGKYTYIVNIIAGGKTYTKVNKSFTIENAKGGDMVGKTAVKLAWPEKTSSSKYSFYSDGSSATEFFESALDIEYPTHNGWSGVGPSVGASCDVFVGTAVRNSGYDKKFPRGLEQQWPYLQSSDKWQIVKNFNRKVEMLRNGDVIIYRKTDAKLGEEGFRGHILIYYKTGGKEGYAEASLPNEKKKTGAYGHLVSGRTAVQTKLNKSYIKYIEVYRATE